MHKPIPVLMTTAALAALALTAGCTTDYDVGANNDAGEGPTAGMSGTSDAGTTPNGTGGNGTGGTGATNRNVPFACDDWGTGEPITSDFDQIHILEMLGHRLWGLPDPNDRPAEAFAIIAPVYGGLLETSGDAACITRHMLTDARAWTGVAEFYRQWLGLGVAPQPDLSVFPEFTPIRMQLLVDRAISFATGRTLTAMGRPQSLFSGVRPVELAPDWGTEKPVNPEQRFTSAGLLSEAALVAKFGRTEKTYVNTDQLGIYLRNTFLCQQVPPPIPGVDDPLPVPQQGEPFRSYHVKITMAQPACVACHALFTPIGLTMDVFDGAGRLRRLDRLGVPFGATDAEIPNSAEAALVTNVGTTAKLIASHERYAPCMANAVANYLLRTLDKERNNDLADTLALRIASDATYADIFAITVRKSIESNSWKP